MNGLISQDILNDILVTTGAYESHDGEKRVLQFGDFRKFSFNIKHKDELNLSVFDNGLDALAALAERIWESYGLAGQKFKYEPITTVDAKNYDFREKALCCQMKIEGCEGSFFLYVNKESFYRLMNVYLGGKPTDSFKSRTALTEIEYIFYNELIGRLVKNLAGSFKYLANFEFQIVKSHIDEIDQIRSFGKKSFMIEFKDAADANVKQFVVFMPEPFMNFIKKKVDEARDSENRKLDPIWKQTVTTVVLNTHLDMKISIGQLTMPFAKSFNLKVGDVFEWNKTTSKVSLIHEDSVRLIGEMGVVGDNYAIKVESIPK